MPSERLILTCEHATAHVPARYLHLFRTARARRALRGHRGHDLGARDVARLLARELRAPLHEARVTRLLVDCNRSLHHRDLFSELSPHGEERERLLREFYHPYRQGVEDDVARTARRGGAVLHVSVHSFAGRLRGEVRRADLGILYDPSRKGERALAAAWRAEIRLRAPDLRVRRNYPYRGIADGLVTHLRRRFGPSDYIGIELEMNQSRIPTARLLGESLAAGLARNLGEGVR